MRSPDALAGSGSCSRARLCRGRRGAPDRATRTQRSGGSAAQGDERDRRARRVRQHLVGHVRAHLEDVARPRPLARALRARALLRHGVSDAPAGDAFREPGAVRALLRRSAAGSPGLAPSLPPSPWSDSFSAGTHISAGLQLALDVVSERHLRRPSVLLVSDLDDDTGDLQRLTDVALAYRHAGIPLRVVGLNPSPEDAHLVANLLAAAGRPPARPAARRRWDVVRRALRVATRTPHRRGRAAARSLRAARRPSALEARVRRAALLAAPPRARPLSLRSRSPTTRARGALPSPGATRTSRRPSPHAGSRTRGCPAMP